MRRCIYADSLLTKIKAYRPYMYLGEDALSYAIKMVELEPSADVRENVRGEWVTVYMTLANNQNGYITEYECNKCNEHQIVKSNFCPNCGADMRTAKQIIHDAIDNTPMAEDEFVGIKEKLHKAVEEV